MGRMLYYLETETTVRSIKMTSKTKPFQRTHAAWKLNQCCLALFMEVENKHEECTN